MSARRKTALIIKTLSLGEESVSVEWTRKNVKNINLRILSDGRVKLSSPFFTSEKTVDAFLAAKAGFIRKALRGRKKKSNLSYRDGEEVVLLGKKYRIHSEKSDNKSVSVRENEIVLFLPSPEDPSEKEKLFLSFRNAECEKVVLCLCEKAFRIYSPFLSTYPHISFRSMTTRWGSCSPEKGNLHFSTMLGAQPLSFIEYVVFHEFTHFLIPNHSPAFYQKLAEMLPDWREKKGSMNREPQ